jgi:chromosome condensin MukBEF ATPase and DNA-binding subunit MukB
MTTTLALQNTFNEAMVRLSVAQSYGTRTDIQNYVSRLLSESTADKMTIDDLVAACARHESKHRASEADSKHLIDNIIVLTGRNEELERANADLCDVIAQHMKDIASAQYTTDNKNLDEIAKLRASLSDRDENIKDLVDRRSNLACAVNALRAENAELKVTISEHEDKAAKWLIAKKELIDNVSYNHEVFTRACKRADNYKDERDALDKELREYKRNAEFNTHLNKEIAKLQENAQIRELKAENKSLKAEVEELTTQIRREGERYKMVSQKADKLLLDSSALTQRLYVTETTHIKEVAKLNSQIADLEAAAHKHSEAYKNAHGIF